MENRRLLARCSLVGAIVVAIIFAVACGGASDGSDNGLGGPAGMGAPARQTATGFPASRAAEAWPTRHLSSTARSRAPLTLN
jgi:hypothetical protein